MDKNTILNYITETPGNTNRAVLGDMLDSFAGGGGGGGDLTTATLTFNGSAYIQAPMCLDIRESGAPIDYALIPFDDEYSSGSYTIALYKGAAVIMVTMVGGTITASGNIQEIDTGTYLVTGDCTITVAP